MSLRSDEVYVLSTIVLTAITLVVIFGVVLYAFPEVTFIPISIQCMIVFVFVFFGRPQIRFAGQPLREVATDEIVRTE